MKGQANDKYSVWCVFYYKSIIQGGGRWTPAGQNAGGPAGLVETAETAETVINL